VAVFLLRKKNDAYGSPPEAIVRFYLQVKTMVNDIKILDHSDIFTKY